jgi:hypothetical protein
MSVYKTCSHDLGSIHYVILNRYQLDIDFAAGGCSTELAQSTLCRPIIAILNRADLYTGRRITTQEKQSTEDGVKGKNLMLHTITDLVFKQLQ